MFLTYLLNALFWALSSVSWILAFYLEWIWCLGNRRNYLSYPSHSSQSYPVSWQTGSCWTSSDVTRWQSCQGVCRRWAHLFRRYVPKGDVVMDRYCSYLLDNLWDNLLWWILLARSADTIKHLLYAFVILREGLWARHSKSLNLEHGCWLDRFQEETITIEFSPMKIVYMPTPDTPHLCQW